MAQSELPAVGDQHEAEQFSSNLQTAPVMMDKEPASTEVGNQPPVIQSSDAVHAPFRLLDLPDELWAEIGRLVIEDLPTIELDSWDFTDPESTSMALAVPGILQTCSALRNELRSDYYRSNKIEVRLYNSPEIYCPEALDDVRLHLQAIGPEARRLLTGYRIEQFCGWSEEYWKRTPLRRLLDWKIEMEIARFERECSCGEHEVQWKIKFL
ncbi:unnamed protein product [Zymoseptoria tritici ST99CH_3D1]|uniref:F-box domain-containing protein n=1 Tax=Zymoseptoria tritici (strain ST99CH_3D7) TaxID=1276538 RepID=A0A1X7RSJ3_ZYMT9|nr:unnamed protein product [Zymoseptoria tritici ST99CH_3D7]SMR52529.1 unnamed protein product [Zymoseptoria tritici ST99CH_3D1]